MFSRWLVVVSLLAASSALAQPRPNQPKQGPPQTIPQPPPDTFEKDLDALFVQGGLTADQAAARGAKASPSVHRKTAETAAASTAVEAAQLAEVPQIGGKASYTRLSFIPPVAFTLIPGQPGFLIQFLRNAYLLEGTVAVPLSDYLVRFPKVIDSAKSGRDVAKQAQRSAEVSAGQDARVAYYEWVRAKLEVLVANRQLAEVRATLGQVQALADAQRVNRAELLRVEAQEADAEQTVDQLTNLAGLREEQLRLAIGASAGESLAIGEDIRQDLTAPGAPGLDELMQRATAHRLEFRVVDAGITAKQKLRDAELANQLPRLSAFAIADYADPNPRFFPQQDVFKYTWQVGLQVTWTINDALISKTTERRLAAETDELRADRENLVNGTRVELLAAAQAVQLAGRALETSQKGLVAAEENYRVRKELLNAERATAVELVDAETELTRARITSLNARVDLRVALAQLAHAAGDDVK